MKIKTMEQKIINLQENLIPQAELIVEQLKPLENSTDSHERMKFLSAKLDLANLKNDLANTRVLITLTQNHQRISPETEEQPAEPGFEQ